MGQENGELPNQRESRFPLVQKMVEFLGDERGMASTTLRPKGRPVGLVGPALAMFLSGSLLMYAGSQWLSGNNGEVRTSDQNLERAGCDFNLGEVASYNPQTRTGTIEFNCK